LVVAEEGVNATIAGVREAVLQLTEEIRSWCGAPTFDCKWSEAPKFPFRNFKVDPRKDLIDAGPGYVAPTIDPATNLSPSEFHKQLSDPATVVLDVRNWYESDLGAFRGAIKPPIKSFGEFPEFIAKSPLDRDASVLIYCTGGIRCEKALTVMREQGFSKVHQLSGGILRYLEEQDQGGSFEGECFVFDSRVAVRADLSPSEQFFLCRRCGDPTKTVEPCRKCGEHVPFCAPCAESHQWCSRQCNSQKSRPQSGARREGLVE
jgi:UPF0176 protein